MLRKWSALVLALLAVPAMAIAQHTGKIAGQVVDASTGETLPGAAVVIAGTTLGTATDIDGNFYIIGVPVGDYNVQASFVGFQTVTQDGVEVSAGYTTQLDFSLSPGVELDELEITYERPLIQKDAIGVPKIVNAEEIVSLPVRGAANVAKIQAGVVSKEGSGTLNIRGGRGSEVTYYVDGVKYGSGGVTVPQSAIQSQEMVIGSINARYGDAMSGIINITTKSGGPKFFGSLEGLTSQQLDEYGYNLGSATLGGPIIADKLSFFVSTEYVAQDDRNPRSMPWARVSDQLLDDLRGAPAGFMVTDSLGNSSVVSIPAGMADGVQMIVDNNGDPDLSGGGITFSDGTVLAVGAGSSVALNPVSRAEQLTADDFTDSFIKQSTSSENLSITGNLTWNVFESGRLRLGGSYNNQRWDDLSSLRAIFAPETRRDGKQANYQLYATWTQYLSNSTFYQLQVDASNLTREYSDPRFGTGWADLLRYGDIQDPVHSALRGYKNVSMVSETRTDDHGTPDDPSDDTEITVQVPTIVDRYSDGLAISNETTAGLVSLVGGSGNGYNKTRNSNFRLQATATTQLGINQVEFGAEYEQRTNRYWDVNASRLARFVADGDPEQIASDATDLNPEGYSRYEDIPTFILDDYVGYYGYNVRGTAEVDEENFEKFLSTDKGKPDADYNIAPYQPIYYGGYVQNKIEFRDIVLNLGLRVDVFDNNQRVFKDKFARRPIVRAGDGGSHPAGIDNDYAVYFSGDDVVGYRDLDGNFYDTAGQPTGAGDVLLNGLVRLSDTQITQDMFTDYEPQVTWMPRIGVSFPVTDQALFFASYGVVAQRPSDRNFASINSLQGTGGANNNSLKPETTTKYELGFRQRVGARSALTISGFSHQINNLIQIRNLREASPSGYSRYENVDFGTVKGLEFGYDLRRTNGVALNANYTLSFADGTGSGDRTARFIVWIDETPPNFISPLSFDQRHKLNISADYRLGSGEGPTIMGSKLLENFGFNVLMTAGSGFPYTGILFPLPVNAARAPFPSGGINNDRMPWSSRIDLRIDRRFVLSSGTSVTAFLWVQNLLNTTNTQGVWRFSGLPDDDGFLATSGGQQFIESAVPASQSMYQHRNRSLGNVGLPRLTRIGVRLDF